MITTTALLALTILTIGPIVASMMIHAFAWTIETDWEDSIVLAFEDTRAWARVQMDGARFVTATHPRTLARARVLTSAPIGVRLAIGYRARLYRAQIIAHAIGDCYTILRRAIRNARNVKGY